MIVPGKLSCPHQKLPYVYLVQSGRCCPETSQDWMCGDLQSISHCEGCDKGSRKWSCLWGWRCPSHVYQQMYNEGFRHPQGTWLLGFRVKQHWSSGGLACPSNLENVNDQQPEMINSVKTIAFIFGLWTQSQAHLVQLFVHFGLYFRMVDEIKKKP